MRQTKDKRFRVSDCRLQMCRLQDEGRLQSAGKEGRLQRRRPREETEIAAICNLPSPFTAICDLPSMCNLPAAHLQSQSAEGRVRETALELPLNLPSLEHLKDIAFLDVLV